MKIVSKFHVSIFYAFRETNRQIVLSDSASPKMVIQIYFIYFRYFVTVLELFECRRCDPYMTVNRNFVRFAHSKNPSVGYGFIYFPSKILCIFFIKPHWERSKEGGWFSGGGEASIEPQWCQETPGSWEVIRLIVVIFPVRKKLNPIS